MKMEKRQKGKQYKYGRIRRKIWKKIKKNIHWERERICIMFITIHWIPLLFLRFQARQKNSN
jgi:hypothetical protein